MTNQKHLLEIDTNVWKSAMERKTHPPESIDQKKNTHENSHGCKYLNPRREVTATDTFWNTYVPLGVNQLYQMLQKMCKEQGELCLTSTQLENHGRTDIV